VIGVQFLVIAEVRDVVVGEDVKRLRGDVAVAVERIQKSGKLLAGGARFCQYCGTALTMTAG